MSAELWVHVATSVMTAMSAGFGVWAAIRADIEHMRTRIEYLEKVTWKKMVDKNES